MPAGSKTLESAFGALEVTEIASRHVTLAQLYMLLLSMPCSITSMGRLCARQSTFRKSRRSVDSELDEAEERYMMKLTKGVTEKEGQSLREILEQEKIHEQRFKISCC